MNRVTKDKVIAIDGPCGSGKSEIARRVAEKLDFVYIDTGAMFRALGVVAFNSGVDLVESPEIKFFLEKLHFEYMVSDKILIQIDGEDLTLKIREHYVSDLASQISRISSVRDYLLELQRSLVANNICIMEGRDIGTVVFPYAFCKIYLTATPEVRAERRRVQLETLDGGGERYTFNQVLNDIKKRDYNDMNREFAPLKKADDATLLDSSRLSLNEVILKIEQIAKDAALLSGISL